MLNHIAINLDDISDWCSKNNMPFDSSCKIYLGHLGKLLELQAKLKINVITVYLLADNADMPSENYLVFSDLIADFFNQLFDNQLALNQHIKISIFGKWYKLPGKSVESIKNIIESTQDCSSFFANFCINYDGQEEIVDACKLIAKQVEAGKIAPDMIAKENIRENLYSSYFSAPDIILIYGERKLSGLLLWDSANSRIAFADKSWMEFEESDVEKLNRNLFK